MPVKLEVSVNRIVELYTKDELSATQVAKELDIAIATVLKYLRLSNIEIRNSFKTTHPRPSREIPLDANRLIYLYNVEHLSSTEIAKRLGITFPTVLRRLKKLGVIINPKHGNPYNKRLININDLPNILTNPKIIHQKLTGVVTCPSCDKTRRLNLNRNRINAILESLGRCNTCSSKSRAIPLDIKSIEYLYNVEHLSVKEIATQFHVGVRTIYGKMKNNGIPRRTKGHTRTLLFKARHKNKGMLESPIMGDVRNGIEIGLQNHGYYVWVECERCKGLRWEAKSRVKRLPYCKPCAMILNGIKHSGENSPQWLGGISFKPYSPDFNESLKRKIRERDNFTCQLCGVPQNGYALAVHHIDYNKKNNSPYNLISLCPSPFKCHNKTTHHREYWQSYFAELITRKYAVTST